MITVQYVQTQMQFQILASALASPGTLGLLQIQIYQDVQNVDLDAVNVHHLLIVRIAMTQMLLLVQVFVSASQALLELRLRILGWQDA